MFIKKLKSIGTLKYFGALLVVLSKLLFAAEVEIQANCKSLSNANETPTETTLNESVIVYVDDFPPYINAKGEPAGASTKTLDALAEYAGVTLEYRYISYKDATKLMSLGKNVISFPYFKTQEREDKFLFTEAFVNISIQIYYNRQYSDYGNIDDISSLKIGIVNGYSYGEKLDKLIQNPIEFDSDEASLNALLNNKIQILPMATGVMNTLLENTFSAQRQLILPIKSIEGAEPLYVMTPKTEFGVHIRCLLNDAIATKFGDTQPTDNMIESTPTADVAELIPAEGFPAILGQDINDEDTHYTLPIGTSVLVLDWSDGIRNPSISKGNNRNMLLTSKVVVLNGPHVGTEMMIRNMHIKLN